jgi:Protein of unknown function (DUF2924)
MGEQERMRYHNADLNLGADRGLCRSSIGGGGAGPHLASSSVAQSFGRDRSRPFAALATPEGSGLSASGGCPSRPRQGDCAFYSRFARRRDRFRRQSLQEAQSEDAGRAWPQLGNAARPRVERQTGKGDGAGQGFAWKGRTFGSLSQVAKAVTGTSWNGHRFFGLLSMKDQGSKRRGHVAAAMNTGSGSLATPRTSAGRNSRTTDAEHASASDEANLSGPVAKAKCPGGHFSRCRVSIPDPKLPVPVEGEPRQNYRAAEARLAALPLHGEPSATRMDWSRSSTRSTINGRRRGSSPNSSRVAAAAIASSMPPCSPLCSTEHWPSCGRG